MDKRLLIALLITSLSSIGIYNYTSDQVDIALETVKIVEPEALKVLNTCLFPSLSEKSCVEEFGEVALKNDALVACNEHPNRLGCKAMNSLFTVRAIYGGGEGGHGYGGSCTACLTCC